MYQALTEAVKSADGDASTNIVVLTGKGEYYTAGNDMKDFEAMKNRVYTLVASQNQLTNLKF